jgi:hypothetical protein
LGNFLSTPKFAGVLVIGDHADFGKGSAGSIPRAGALKSKHE